MTDPRQRIGTALVVLAVAVYAVIGFNLAQSWTSDLKLWSRVVSESPFHARAILNLGDAYARGRLKTFSVNTVGFPESAAVTQRYEDPAQVKLALFWFAVARIAAKLHPTMPILERNVILAVADQNLVTLLIGWTEPNPLDTTYRPKPWLPLDYVAMAAYSGERAQLITKLLEEIWQIQQSGAYIVR